jgi:predicted acetyltransferase
MSLRDVYNGQGQLSHCGLTMISLDPAAPEERGTLLNLLQLYVYDWSELLSLDVGVDGRFADCPLDVYWTEGWRHPFLLRVDGQLAGFALVTERSRLTGTAGVVDMSEFFVMRRYRKRGVGFAAACAAFERFKGPWEVRQRRDNVDATAFWRKVIARHTNGKYDEVDWNDATWTGPVQRFSTG